MLLKTNVSQAAIIQNKNQQILILQLPSGEWHFPGGRLNCNETWQDGLYREVKEEIGIIDFKIISMLCVENWIQRSTQTPCLGIFFHCYTPKVQQVNLSFEHKSFAWVDKTTDLSKFVFYHHRIKEIIQSILNKQKKIIKPPQDLSLAVSVKPVPKGTLLQNKTI